MVALVSEHFMLKLGVNVPVKWFKINVSLGFDFLYVILILKTFTCNTQTNETNKHTILPK